MFKFRERSCASYLISLAALVAGRRWLLTLLLAGFLGCVMNGRAVAANDAAFTTQTALSNMTVGESYAFSVTMKNVGTTTWTTNGGYALVLQNSSGWSLSSIANTVAVAANSSRAFSGTISPPATPGSYTLQWCLTQNGAVFGACSTPLTIQVAARAPDATFGTQTTFTTQTTATRTMTVTMKNTGNTTWKSTQVFLGTQNPQDNMTWGINRLKLSTATVAPNATGNFTGTITAPASGYYDLQWQALEEGKGYFGDPTPNQNIAVAGGVPVLTVLSPTSDTTLINNGGKVDFHIQATATPMGIATINKIFIYLKDADGIPVSIYESAGPEFDYVRHLTGLQYSNKTAGVYIQAVDSFNKRSPEKLVSAKILHDYSTIVSDTVPKAMVPGQPYEFDITFKNTGDITWNPQTVTLGPSSPTIAATWGDFSVPLSNAVVPGDSATFHVKLTAPSTEGSFNLFMQLRESTRSQFGAVPQRYITVARQAPVVTMTSPSTGFSVDVPTATKGAVRVQGRAEPGIAASISKIEVLDGSAVIATADADTIDQDVSLAVGTHSIRLRATDNWKETGLSAIATVTVKGNDAAFYSQSVPAKMEVGKAYTATVTMRNSGNKPWVATSGYSLGSQNPAYNTIWRDPLVSAPSNATVAAGGSVTFSVPIVAPTVPGKYNFQWQMVQDGTEWFGAMTPNVEVTVNPAAPYAERLNMPTIGDKFLAVNGKADVRLQGVAWPGDGAIITKLEVLDGATVIATDDSATIDTVVHLVPGTHTLKLRATDNFNQVFTATLTTAITVLSNNATAVSRTAATSMVGGTPYQVTVVMRNSGTSTWTPEEGYALGPVPDNGAWVAQYIPVTDYVAPGANATFTFDVTAPGDPAAYPFQWQMLRQNKAGVVTEWFGSKSTLQTITVTGVPPTVNLSGPVANTSYLAKNGTAQVPVSGSAKATGTATITLFEVLDGTKVVYSGSGNTMNTSVALAPGVHTLQLRATDSRKAVTLSQTTTVTVLHHDATISAISVPSTMYAGDHYTVIVAVKNTGDTTWQPYSAQTQSGVALAELPIGGAVWSAKGRVQLTKAVAPGETYSFNLDIVAPLAPKVYPFQWRMSDESNGLFGSASTLANVTVVAPPVPVVAFAASPVNQRVAPGQLATVALTGSGLLQAGVLSKLEVFADSGSGYGATPVKTVTGNAAKLSLDESLALSNGSYRLKLRASDGSGHFADSAPVTVNVTDSTLLGQLIGVRSTGSQQLQLIGWVCRDGAAEALNYQVFVNAPPALGGVQVASGAANLGGEANDAAVQAQCHTPGASHFFAVDVVSLQAQYPGAPLFVAARSAQGETVVLPCEDHGCRVPDGLRIGLASPNVNNLDRFRSPIPVFARAVVTGSSSTPDEVSFNINGEWLPGAAEGAGSYSVSKSGLPASAVPYTAYAKVRQGETTLISDTHLFYVDPGIEPGKISPESGTTVASGRSVTLRTVVNASVEPGQTVKFFIDPEQSTAKLARQGAASQARASRALAGAAATTTTGVIGEATLINGEWSYVWTPMQEGVYRITAKLLDQGGNALMTTSEARLTVSGHLSPSDPTALPVAAIPRVEELLQLPTAGTLPGAINVDNAGAATYNIPLAVPPGTAGVQPALSLNYNSGGPNGQLGLGWSLGGMSAVQRCGRTIAQDGVNDRISYSKTDRLCLDGQRLTLVNLPLTDDNYWADNAEYRTELESYARITAVVVGGHRGFKVDTRDGRIRTYGAGSAYVTPVLGAPNSGAGAEPPTPKSGARVWALDGEVDRSGNFIRYSYEMSSNNGEYRIASISYGGNGRAAHAGVSFAYGDRKDAWTRYLDETRVDQRSRLVSIKTFVGDDLNNGVSNGTWVREYTLGYEYSATSGRSLLNSVTVCARHPDHGTSQCQPPTTFAWGKPDPSKTPGFVQKGFWNGPLLTTVNLPRVAANPTAAHTNHPDYFAFSDFENHGLTDVLEKRVASVIPSNPDTADQTYLNMSNPLPPGTMRNQYRYFHNTGSNFVQYNYNISVNGLNPLFAVLDFGDFDGDGAPDLLVATQDMGAKICRSPLATSAGLPAAGGTITFTCTERPAVGSNEEFGLPTIVDVYGDGRVAHYGPYDLNGNTQFCSATGCVADPEPPSDMLTPARTGAQPPMQSQRDHVTFTQMIDFAGIGRAADVRWTLPYLWQYIDTDGTPSNIYQWLNPQAQVVVRDMGAPGTPIPRGVGGFAYPEIPNLCPDLSCMPYSFDYPSGGGALSADFNGAGYSGVIYGYMGLDMGTHRLKAPELTLCLSTGRSLDCRVRQKYSGSNYVSSLTIGDFVGDGAPAILANEAKLRSTQGFGVTGSLRICRVMGDDTTGGASADDANMHCEPWGGLTYPQSTGSATAAHDQVFVMDLEGTGRPQLVYYHAGKVVNGSWQEDGRWELFAPIELARDREALDRIVGVTNGLGASSSVEYLDGIAAGIVTQSAAAVSQYPRRNARSPGKVVSRLVADNGVAGVRSTNYRYVDPASDLTGRGAAGFGNVIATDEQTGIVTSTQYAQNWPLVGMTQDQTVRSKEGTVLQDIERSLLTQRFTHAYGAVTTFPYTETVTVRRADLLGSDLGTVVTKDIYGDGWGNITNRTITTSAASAPDRKFVTTVATTFRNDNSLWLIGLPTMLIETRTDPGSGTLTRTVEKKYDDVTGLLTREVIEPGNTALSRAVGYGRADNLFGLVNTMTESWTDPYSGLEQSRITSTVYDAAGRFPTLLTNALGHREDSRYQPGSGAKVSLTGPNQLTTTWQVDGYGRVEIELGADKSELRHYIKRCDSNCPAGAVIADITEHYNANERTAVPTVSYADTAGHVLQTQTWGYDGRTIIAEQTYDSMGRPFEQYWPRFDGDEQHLQRRVYYDALNRPVKVETLDDVGTQLTATTTYSGMSLEQQNPKLQRRLEERNAIGQLQKVTDSADGETSFTYDPYGNLLTTKDPMGNKSSVIYDLLGRRTDLDDPDLGKIHYEVDPLGRVWKTVSPKQRTAGTFTRTVFDKLDRMIDRYETDLESHWVYDTEAHGIGKLAEAYTGQPERKDYRRLHAYDDLGRPASSTQYINGDSYASRTVFDAWGRVMQQKLQRNEDIEKVFDYRYNDKGYLARIERSGLALWSVSSQDAVNRVRVSKLGNGLLQARNFGANTGLLSGVLLETATNQRRLQEDYLFDAVANVQQRSQYWEQTGFTEVFGYDRLNRIENSEIVGKDKQSFTYYPSGNIKTKSKTNAGGALISNMVYSYPVAGSARPHAVKSITGQGGGDFGYDDNGNQLIAPNRTADWNSFDMPSVLKKGDVSQGFVYGPEHQRVRMDRTDNNTAVVYGGGQEVELANGTVTAVKTYWPNGLGLEIDKPGESTELLWTHADRLGSIVGLTGISGELKERLAYDAWGKRRSPDGTSDADSIDGEIDRRGFTGHEMLDQLDLVHMNGRIYDPLYSRFLSADALVQDPTNGQNYNRYSYVLNNPTNFTDPTGFQTDYPEEMKRTKSAIQSACARSAMMVGQCGASIMEAARKLLVETPGAYIAEVVSDIASAGTKANKNSASSEMSPNNTTGGVVSAKAATATDGSALGELDIPKVIVQGYRRTMANFADNNRGAFGYWGWAAGLADKYVQRPDSSAEGRVANVLLLGLTLRSPGGVRSEIAKEIQLSRKLHGEAAVHAAEAIEAGAPSILTIDRAGAAANRKAATGALDKVPGMQLDEYPPAMFREGGAGASVRPINPSNNMSAGACIGNACRGLPDGAKVRITVGD